MIYYNTADENVISKAFSLDARLSKNIDLLIKRYPVLKVIRSNIIEAYHVMEACFSQKNKLMIAGNGGSAADAEHIVGELMKGFKLERKPDQSFQDLLVSTDSVRGKVLADKLQGGLPAIALNNHQALSSAYLNDVDGTLCYAQQVYGYGKENDVLLAISTSGNSQNVMYAAVVAKAIGIKVIALTGKSGGELKKIADVCVNVPEEETYMIQELHLPIYHCWCLMLENRFFA